MSNIYGYIRVSTKDQNEDRQIIALSKFNISKKNIYMDKLSGKDFNRPQYKKMIRKIRKGTFSSIIKSKMFVVNPTSYNNFISRFC